MDVVRFAEEDEAHRRLKEKLLRQASRQSLVSSHTNTEAEEEHSEGSSCVSASLPSGNSSSHVNSFSLSSASITSSGGYKRLSLELSDDEKDEPDDETSGLDRMLRLQFPSVEVETRKDSKPNDGPLVSSQSNANKHGVNSGSPSKSFIPERKESKVERKILSHKNMSREKRSGKDIPKRSNVLRPHRSRNDFNKLSKILEDEDIEPLIFAPSPNQKTRSKRKAKERESRDTTLSSILSKQTRSKRRKKNQNHRHDRISQMSQMSQTKRSITSSGTRNTRNTRNRFEGSQEEPLPLLSTQLASFSSQSRRNTKQLTMQRRMNTNNKRMPSAEIEIEDFEDSTIQQKKKYTGKNVKKVINETITADEIIEDDGPSEYHERQPTSWGKESFSSPLRLEKDNIAEEYSRPVSEWIKTGGQTLLTPSIPGRRKEVYNTFGSSVKRPNIRRRGKLSKNGSRTRGPSMLYELLDSSNAKLDTKLREFEHWDVEETSTCLRAGENPWSKMFLRLFVKDVSQEAHLYNLACCVMDGFNSPNGDIFSGSEINLFISKPECPTPKNKKITSSLAQRRLLERLGHLAGISNASELKNTELKVYWPWQELGSSTLIPLSLVLVEKRNSNFLAHSYASKSLESASMTPGIDMNSLSQRPNTEKAYTNFTCSENFVNRLKLRSIENSGCESVSGDIVIVLPRDMFVLRNHNKRSSTGQSAIQMAGLDVVSTPPPNSMMSSILIRAVNGVNASREILSHETNNSVLAEVLISPLLMSKWIDVVCAIPGSRLKLKFLKLVMTKRIHDESGASSVISAPTLLGGKLIQWDTFAKQSGIVIKYPCIHTTYVADENTIFEISQPVEKDKCRDITEQVYCDFFSLRQLGESSDRILSTRICMLCRIVCVEKNVLYYSWVNSSSASDCRYGNKNEQMYVSIEETRVLWILQRLAPDTLVLLKNILLCQRKEKEQTYLHADSVTMVETIILSKDDSRKENDDSLTGMMELLSTDGNAGDKSNKIIKNVIEWSRDCKNKIQLLSEVEDGECMRRADSSIIGFQNISLSLPVLRRVLHQPPSFSQGSFPPHEKRK